jgi:hypothetical protein
MKRSTAGRAKSARLDTNALVSCNLVLLAGIVISSGRCEQRTGDALLGSGRTQRRAGIERNSNLGL